MVDSIDPPLEARLRAVLRAEAKTLPLLVTPSQVVAVQQGRRRRSLVAPAVTAVAAAAVAVLVVAAAWPKAGVDQGSAAAPTSPAGAPLAPYDELIAMLPADAVTPVLQGQNVDGGGATGDITTEMGAIGAGSPVAYALSCAGDAVTITFDNGDGTPDTMSLACADSAVGGSLSWEAGPARVTVTAPARLPWRLVLASGSGPARDLAEPMELRQIAQLARTTGGVSIAQGEGPDAAATGAILTTDLGSIGTVQDIELAFDCLGGDIEIRVTDGDTVLAGHMGACAPTAQIVNLAVATANPRAHLVVVATKDVRWRLLAVGPGPTGSAVP